jgi:hypothetical protein
MGNIWYKNSFRKKCPEYLEVRPASDEVLDIPGVKNRFE